MGSKSHKKCLPIRSPWMRSKSHKNCLPIRSPCMRSKSHKNCLPIRSHWMESKFFFFSCPKSNYPERRNQVRRRLNQRILRKKGLRRKRADIFVSNKSIFEQNCVRKKQPFRTFSRNSWFYERRAFGWRADIFVSNKSNFEHIWFSNTFEFRTHLIIEQIWL
jgi:hypothetical protein